MSRFLISLAVLALIGTTVAPHLARGDDDEKAKASSLWMKQKLVRLSEHSGRPDKGRL